MSFFRISNIQNKVLKIKLTNRDFFSVESAGYWQITFYGGEAHKLATGHFCDDFGPCDPYIKVLIDDIEVFRTETKTAQRHPVFKETYYSPRMRKNAKITIEMWDNDNPQHCLGSPDELMSRWDDGRVSSLSRYTTLADHLWDDEYQNKIDYSSSWIDDYLFYS